jgi:hypothetical protein
MPIPFLKARWSNVCLVTYAVPPALLRPRVPAGLDLDLRDGQAFVSLVAFDFLDTRVLSVGWPGYRNFAEINLRFYVRRGLERGVVFVREFVPQRLTVWLARLLYNEPYAAAPIRSFVRQDETTITVEHRLEWARQTHTIIVTGEKPPYCPDERSTEHFFKEHHWGYGISRRGIPIRYEVQHPIWEVYPVKHFAIDLDWSLVYGPEWRFLQDQTPCSTVLAVGSGVAVYPKGKVAPETQKPLPRLTPSPGTA